VRAAYAVEWPACAGDERAEVSTHGERSAVPTTGFDLWHIHMYTSVLQPIALVMKASVALPSLCMLSACCIVCRCPYGTASSGGQSCATSRCNTAWSWHSDAAQCHCEHPLSLAVQHQGFAAGWDKVVSSRVWCAVHTFMRWLTRLPALAASTWQRGRRAAA
jgi:hypothetical protein